MGGGVNNLLLELGRCGANFESTSRVVKKLENYAFSFPEYRKEVIEVLESYATSKQDLEAKVIAKDAAERLAAVTMLESLNQ